MKKAVPISRAKRKDRSQGPAAATKPPPPEVHIRPQNGLEGFEFLTPCEAITWAAFGQAVKAEDLVRVLPPELARWSSEPRHWLPKLFHRHRREVLWGEFSPSEILDTLMVFDDSVDTLSEEQLRPIIFYLKNREKLGLSPFRIIRGRTTSEHIEFLRQYLAKAADVELKLIESRREFLKLISLGHIVLSGLPVDSYKLGKRPRERISGEAFLPGVSISFDGYLADASGWTLFEGLFVELDGVRRCYPFGPIEPINPFLLQLQQPPNTSKQPETVRQLKGGRPRGESTLLAQSELARLLASGKLPQKPKEILAHLEEFFAREGKTMPAESTLKEMIRAFLQGLKQSKNLSENLAGN